MHPQYGFIALDGEPRKALPIPTAHHQATFMPKPRPIRDPVPELISGGWRLQLVRAPDRSGRLTCPFHQAQAPIQSFDEALTAALQ